MRGLFGFRGWRLVLHFLVGCVVGIGVGIGIVVEVFYLVGRDHIEGCEV